MFLDNIINKLTYDLESGLSIKPSLGDVTAAERHSNSWKKKYYK